MPSAVFCYAAPDVEIARDLGAYLELNCPVEAYYDEGRVRFGFDLVAAAERAAAADIGIVLLSPDSVPGEWKRERWEPVFFESGNHIAFVLLRECSFPQLLRRRTFFDFPQDSIAGRRALKRWVLTGYRLPVTAFDVPRGHALPGEVMERLRRDLADRPGSEWLDRETAVSFAHSCAQDFEGVFWIDCAHRGVTGILGETGHALGLRLTGPPLAGRAKVRDFCAAHRCLYIFEGIAEEHWEIADLGGKASVIITLPDETTRPWRPEELRSLFSAWIRNEEACLRALGEAEWHLRGGSWPEVQELGVAAVALLKHHERMAEAHEFLELLANSAQAAGDPARAWQLRWDQTWILEQWGHPVARDHAAGPAQEAAQLSLDFAAG